ncbi:MAG: hypothetical protein K6F00_04065 [Lachnospiraceae bacterium]|nr:hypothetical protein [Lachnospiraceae bacterium]
MSDDKILKENEAIKIDHEDIFRDIENEYEELGLDPFNTGFYVDEEEKDKLINSLDDKIITDVHISFPKLKDFYEEDDITRAKLKEFKDIEENTEPKLFKSKETRIKEKKEKAEGRYKKIREQRIKSAKRLFNVDKVDGEDVATGYMRDVYAQIVPENKYIKNFDLPGDLRKSAVEEYTNDLKKFLSKPVELGDISNDGNLLNAAKAAYDFKHECDLLVAFMKDDQRKLWVKEQVGEPDFINMENKLTLKSENLNKITGFLKSEVIRIGKGEKRSMNNKWDNSLSYEDFANMKQDGIVIGNINPYIRDAEIKKDKPVFANSLFNEYADKFSEVLTDAQREEMINDERTELYAKNKNFESLKKADLADRVNRDIEAAARRKVPVDIKKKVKFSLVKDLSVVANILSGDKKNGILDKLQKIINDYALGKAESRDELLHMLEEKIMNVNFSKFDLSDEARIAENAEYLDSVTRMISAYDKILKDSGAVLGDKFKNRSKLLADKMNAKLGEDDVKTSDDAFTGKLEKLRDLCSLYRAKKMIMKNPYYVSHTKDEISTSISKDTPMDQVILAKMIRTSNYLAKNVCYSNNIKDYKFDDNLSKDGSEIDRIRESEIAFISKDALDYCNNASLENTKTYRIKEEIKKYYKILDDTNGEKLTQEELNQYLKIIAIHEEEERIQNDRIKAGENIPEEERLKPLPVSNIGIRLYYNLKHKQDTGEYLDKTHDKHVEKEQIDELIGKLPQIKATIRNFVQEESDKAVLKLTEEQEKLKNKAINNDRVKATEDILESLELDALKYSDKGFELDLDTIEDKKMDKNMLIHAKGGLSADKGLVYFPISEKYNNNRKDYQEFQKKYTEAYKGVATMGIHSPRFGKIMDNVGDQYARMNSAMGSSVFNHMTEEEILEMIDNLVLARKSKNIEDTEGYKKAVENEMKEREKAKAENIQRRDITISNTATIGTDVEENRQNGFDDEYVRYAEDAFVDGYYKITTAFNGKMLSLVNSLGDSFINAHPADRVKMFNKYNSALILQILPTTTNYSNVPLVRFFNEFTDKDGEQLNGFGELTGVFCTYPFSVGEYSKYIRGLNYESEEKMAAKFQNKIKSINDKLKELEPKLESAALDEKERNKIEEQINDLKYDREMMQTAIEKEDCDFFCYMDKTLKDSDWKKETYYEPEGEEYKDRNEVLDESSMADYEEKYKVGFEQYKKFNTHIKTDSKEKLDKYNRRLEKRGLKRMGNTERDFYNVNELYTLEKNEGLTKFQYNRRMDQFQKDKKEKAGEN